jgi:release factor glutamine methyltransferase
MHVFGFWRSSEIYNMETLLSILQKTTDYFRKYEIDTPKLDAELILAHVLDCKRMQLYLDFDRPMTEDILQKLRPLVKRRAAREPIQYLVGKEGFRDFVVLTDPRGLIPRPETEELVEWVVTSVKLPPGARVADLGTGSGVIACALCLAFPEAQVVATDNSADTLDLARSNAEKLGLADRITLVRSDWYQSLEGKFHLLVSNPPYLSESDYAHVQPELARYEPRRALVSGPTGLECIQILLSGANTRLHPGASIFLEIGDTQANAVRELVKQLPGWKVETKRDLAQKERFVRITAPDTIG